MSKKKKPRQAEDIHTGKQVRRETGDPSEQERFPSWRLALMDLTTDKNWGWGGVGLEKLLEIRARLGAWESMTWSEIVPAGSHAVEVGKIIRPAQKILAERRLDDAPQLYSLRLTGKERVWGFRHGHVFQLLWWDPDHEICPSLKKHT